jgi:hypothetical protein
VNDDYPHFTCDEMEDRTGGTVEVCGVSLFHDNSVRDQSRIFCPDRVGSMGEL